MPDLSDTLRKCRIGTAKKFTLLLLLYHTQANSQETHWMRLRQQDPATSLWSMCQITTFASAAGARVSIIVDWYYTGATFTVPTV